MQFGLAGFFDFALIGLAANMKSSGRWDAGHSRPDRTHRLKVLACGLLAGSLLAKSFFSDAQLLVCSLCKPFETSQQGTATQLMMSRNSVFRLLLRRTTNELLVMCLDNLADVTTFGVW